MQLDNETISLASLINICEKSPYNLEELQGLVKDWAKDKELIKEANSHNQYMKIIEEYGELCSSVLKLEKQGIEPLIDSIGDVLVTITIILAQLDRKQFLEVSRADVREGNVYGLHRRFIENYTKRDFFGAAEMVQSIAHLYNLNPVECLWYSYQTISKRKGYTTEQGTFIKDEPPQIENEIPQYEID